MVSTMMHGQQQQSKASMVSTMMHGRQQQSKAFTAVAQECLTLTTTFKIKILVKEEVQKHHR